ncbi:MAG TPA: hypothetical protein VJS44_00140 [Pyrinomonadaceae bacterium]|nr:hypothetical protein [Pyrinomonadaceae bacterium]
MKLHIFFTVALILLACSHQAAPAQEGRTSRCPVINVAAPELNSTGRTLIYRANIQGGDSSVTPTFNWTVSVGKITGGQGTAEVSVDAEGSNSLTVTVEVIGYSASCPNKASYGWVVDRPAPRKYDEYGNLKFNEERLRLDQFATELRKEPGAKGYILVYDRTDILRSQAYERGEKARNYLVKEYGFQEAQVVLVNGGYREKRSVELFITPAGAMPPTHAPAVSSK